MDEKRELIQDHKDCIDYLRNIDNYEYAKLSKWADIKYSQWGSKDREYLFYIHRRSNITKKCKRACI